MRKLRADWKSWATLPEGARAGGDPAIGLDAVAAPSTVTMVAACPFPSLRGSQVFIRELAAGLARRGHRVHVVTYPTAQHLVPVGSMAIHRLPRLPGLRTARPFTWRKIALDAMLVARAWSVSRRVGAEILHGHNAEGGLVGLAVRALGGPPVVYHAHSALVDELPAYARRRWGKYALRRIGALLDRWIASRADAVIAPNPRLAAYLAARGAAGRVRFIPPHAEVPALAVSGGRGPSGDARGGTIAYAGNLDPYQDLDVLLGAFEKMRARRRDVRLLLVTHPGDWERTRLLACRLGRVPGVRVVEVATFAAAMRVLREADVLVAPRGSWSGFPVKIVNYLALSVPVVHSQAVARALGGPVGPVFPDGDAEALAGRVLEALDDPRRGVELAKEGARRLREGAGRSLGAVERVYDAARRRKTQKRH